MRSLGYPCRKMVFGASLPDENPQTVLFSKPILLAGGKIAQIWAESQFYPDFGNVIKNLHLPKGD
jgi:hypothetical protein